MPQSLKSAAENYDGYGHGYAVGPPSPHSHSSAAHLSDEETSKPLPVPCFQPKPVKREQPCKLERKPVSSGFAPCGPAPNFMPDLKTGPLLPPLRFTRSKTCRAGGKDLEDALCEAGIVGLPMRRSHSDGLALSSSTAYPEGRVDTDSEGEEHSCRQKSPEDSPRGSTASGDSCTAQDIQKSSFRGVSYDKKKRKWRVQIKVANLGKSGVSVGYYDTQEAAAKAYDRAAISLLGKDNGSISTNFPLKQYQEDQLMPQLVGKTRDEVKAMLKNERVKVPRRKYTSRQRTSKYMGVGSSNRKNQWQARILVHGKVTHLGYYETEEDAAKVYDRVAISLNGADAATNFPPSHYSRLGAAEFQGLGREDLQRALGVKPMDKSSQFRGVSRKKGKWEAKVMVNRKWAYRALFDSEDEAARAYDAAVWRLKPREAGSFINFKDGVAANSAKRARGQVTAMRTKSQKLESKSSAGSLPPLGPQTSPQVSQECETPSTPSRRHSVQLPLSQPLSSRVIARAGSAAATLGDDLPGGDSQEGEKMLFVHGEKVAQLQSEDLLQMPEGSSQSHFMFDNSPQQSSFSRRPSYSQLQSSLQSSLSGVPMMPLPDPNSIGVPPPDNLPYPELVSMGTQQMSTAGFVHDAAAASMMHLPCVSAPPNPTLLAASLPDIPTPLLPTKVSSMGMSNCFSNTQMSHELANALSASASHLQELQAAESQQQPQQQQPNPFQEASTFYPPITSQPSAHDLEVRTGSEAHLIPDHQSMGMHKLNSLTASLDVFPCKQGSANMSRLASVNSAVLARAASESVLKSCPSRSLAELGQLSGMQMDPAYVTTFEAMPHSGSLMAQRSLSGHTRGIGQMPLHSSRGSANSFTANGPRMPQTVFTDQTNMGPYEASGLSHMDTPCGLSQLHHAVSFGNDLSSFMSGGTPINRSMSTSDLLRSGRLPGYGSSTGLSLQHSGTSANQLYNLQHSASTDSSPLIQPQLGLPPLPTKPDPEHFPLDSLAMDPPELRPSDATELLAELGVDMSIPDCHSPLNMMQIGGEDLHIYVANNTDGAFLLNDGN